MKKYFVTGLIILLPLTVTILLVRFFFNLLTEPFIGIVGPLIDHFFPGQVHPHITELVSQLLILVVLFLFTVGLGMLTRWFFLHSLLHYGEQLIQRIPLIRSVYKASKDVIHTIFSERSTAFKQVVLVPFPTRDTRSIGLITQADVTTLTHGKTDQLVAVFVPTTPNPTSGFLIMYSPSELVYLDLSVENALKFVISCGVIMAPIHPKEAPPGVSA
jgi:uncharacterized membrane protein